MHYQAPVQSDAQKAPFVLIWIWSMGGFFYYLHSEPGLLQNTVGHPATAGSTHPMPTLLPILAQFQICHVFCHCGYSIETTLHYIRTPLIAAEQKESSSMSPAQSLGHSLGNLILVIPFSFPQKSLA
jgi:hypothetical protein